VLIADFRNLAMLRAAKSYAKSLDSIAVTGSINALTTGSPDELKANELTNSFWNSISRSEARDSGNTYLWYCSSKKEAELAIWDFIKTEQPSFTVTVLLPALIFGPPIQPIKSINRLNYSVGVLYSLVNGINATVPPTSFPSYIDVRDLAKAHVNALTIPEAANKRFLVDGRKMTYTDIVRTLRTLVEKGEFDEEFGKRLPADSGEDKNVTFARISAEEGNKVLRLEPLRTMEQTFGDAYKKLLELEAKEKAQ
jgi:nucleoside-diphosphate-sugar epimerase